MTRGMPVKAPVTAVGREGSASEGYGSTPPYCEGGCGHDLHPNHRGGRCWTDAEGEPITRARTLIDCTCTEVPR